MNRMDLVTSHGHVALRLLAGSPSVSEIRVRPANESDVPSIAAFIKTFPTALRPRSAEDILQTLPGWVVAVEWSHPFPTETILNSSQLLGCGSLVAITDNRVEIRSLAVTPEGQSKGAGLQMMLKLQRMAKEKGFVEICAHRSGKRYYRSSLSEDGTWSNYSRSRCCSAPSVCDVCTFWIGQR